jgi:hypothetical protein
VADNGWREVVGLMKALHSWRHKLLSALKQMDFKQFEGIVEVDEHYFLYSEKGKRVISKEFLLTSFVFEMTDTYESLRLAKFNV